MTKQTKMVLRDILKKRIDPETVTRISGGVVDGLVKVLNKHSEVRTILLYTPVGKWGEPVLSSLPSLFPDIQFEMLKSERTTSFPMKEFDAIIIPLLGFNAAGYRLGHGGGWYDMFLASQPRALKIGVGHEDALVEFDAEAHDIRMDILVTERIIRVFRER